MDENRYMILLDGQDKTGEIETIVETTTGFDIRFFGNGKVYSYRKTKVAVYEKPNSIDPASLRVSTKERCLFNIVKILDFGTRLRIFYSNGKISSYAKNELRLEHNALTGDGNARHVLEYLKELSKIISSENNDFLQNQYEKLDFVSQDSTFERYLKKGTIEKRPYAKARIFPFGLNLSQEAAVEKALTHQVSIIEGPPGTGKTQTILNIIANLLMDNRTIAVVSNNNAAIQNVYDKLEAYNLSFFTAMLGNKDNQQTFFDNQWNVYPNIHDTGKEHPLKNRHVLEQRIVEIREMLQAHNDLAKSSMELEAIQTEKEHFMRMYAIESRERSYVSVLARLGIESVLSFWAELEALQLQKKKATFLFKIKGLFKYGLFSFGLYRYELDEIILFLEKRFYELKEKALEKDIFNLEKRLKDAQFETVLENYKNSSMALLKLHLMERYDAAEKRSQFTQKTFKKEFGAFTKEYPVVLSTTHSLRNCKPENFLYDYLIIDEASQVDVVAGGLALSCAKNVVIVGDLKQLPHVVSDEVGRVTNGVYQRYDLDPCYRYTHSLLASASMVFRDVPKTLLKEHYRCHPKVIDFCNKKFYNGELIILSQGERNADPLVLMNTAEGNHARGKSNQRQIDVIKNEILPRIQTHDLGIVSPFREQVTKLSLNVDNEMGIEIDTVHKYQGREKEAMIITTVVDRENKFADNPNLLNVAISRAKAQLYVVVSDREKNKNMKDLVNYIRYNNYEIGESKIYSIFDLLYQSYAPYLRKYLGKIKKISAFQSENLMNVIIEEVLAYDRYAYLKHVAHYPLHRLISDTRVLNKEESTFVQASSHIDFLLYNGISKQPVLAIEVDGVAYHANNPLQLKRDALKDRILAKYGIPIIRFATDGSEEKEKLLGKLKEVTGD